MSRSSRPCSFESARKARTRYTRVMSRCMGHDMARAVCGVIRCRKCGMVETYDPEMNIWHGLATITKCPEAKE
jgi:hypothetical protein